MERLKMIIDSKEEFVKLIQANEDGTIRIEFPSYDSDGFYNGIEQKTVLPLYAIIHHSEMTDCNLYFIAHDNKILIDNENAINEFMASDFDNAEKIFNKIGIEYKHEEYDDIPKYLIVLKKYSYIFYKGEK